MPLLLQARDAARCMTAVSQVVGDEVMAGNRVSRRVVGTKLPVGVPVLGSTQVAEPRPVPRNWPLL